MDVSEILLTKLFQTKGKLTVLLATEIFISLSSTSVVLIVTNQSDF